MANGRMAGEPLHKLGSLGFSEYEAKAYLALLRQSPATGYQVSKASGVPRSMIYEVLGKLVARGAAMTLHKEGANKYAPVPAGDFLDQLRSEHERLVTSLKNELQSAAATSALEYVWNIDGHDHVMAKAVEMIDQASQDVYLSLMPQTFPAVRPALAAAVDRGVRVVLYSTDDVDLPGGRVVVSPVPERARERLAGLWLIMVVDGREALIGELLTENHARASWTGSPLFVFVAEHHLRTDLYLPRVLALLGDEALDLIDEADRELFAVPFESRLKH
jgi:sugar-specific transcriptional regulator TrmB